MTRRALLVALAVLLAITLASRALALSDSKTTTGDKAAVDKEGKGTRYSFSAEVKSDPPIKGTTVSPHKGGVRKK